MEVMKNFEVGDLVRLPSAKNNIANAEGIVTGMHTLDFGLIDVAWCRSVASFGLEHLELISRPVYMTEERIFALEMLHDFARNDAYTERQYKALDLLQEMIKEAKP
jgi:hypothetical protein